ncbi:MAG: carbohydrate-binding protein [Breznakibacter sp.]
MDSSFGVNTNAGDEDDRYVDGIGNGDWIHIKNVNFGKLGAKRFMALVAGGGKGGKIEVHLGSPDGLLVGTIEIHPTGGKQHWKEYSAFVDNAVGVHDI